MAAVTAEPAIFGAGTSQSDWAAHGGLDRLPVCEIEALLPPRSRLVVVAPHPDDEVLACGGLLAVAAARGHLTLVVSVSDGEASHAGSAQWTVQRLRDRRRLEWAEGLRRLGLNPCDHVRLALPDGAVHAHRHALRSRLQSLLSKRDVVVTTYRHDGHPDHETVAAVCEACGARSIEAPVWMWHWAAPRDARVPWARLHRLALPAEALCRKQHAIAAHRSQLEPRDAEHGAVLSPATLARLLRADEFFFLP